MENILDIEKCHCSRKYCDFVNHNGECSHSYEREEIEKMLKDLQSNKVVNHLKKLLK